MKTGQHLHPGLGGSKEDRLQARLENLLERKPDLELKPNHRKQPRTIKRVWNRGTAYSDGKGWYRNRPLNQVT